MSHSHILCIVVILGFFSCKEKNSIPAENIEAVATDSLAFQNYNKGIELASKYEFENALPYLLKSVDGFEKANNINSQVKALNRISLSYHDFGNYDKGIEYAYLAKAFTICNKPIKIFIGTCTTMQALIMMTVSDRNKH